jgi:cytochrome P450
LYGRRTVYFPFGLGPRVCVGEEYGWMNGMLVMATLGRRWRLRLVPGHPIELLPRTGLGSKYGMRMVCEPRP